VIILYAAARCDPPRSAAELAAGVLPLLLAVAVLYSIGFMLSTLNIWFTKLWNLPMALQSVLEAGRYPVDAYPPAYRVVFSVVLPVVFLTTVPAQAISGRGAVTWWVVCAAVLAVLLLAASRLFWYFALRYYTSASS
jgi:ABC-2 type transport system permease protein